MTGVFSLVIAIEFGLEPAHIRAIASSFQMLGVVALSVASRITFILKEPGYGHGEAIPIDPSHEFTREKVLQINQITFALKTLRRTLNRTISRGHST